jgi:hypothetical protein
MTKVSYDLENYNRCLCGGCPVNRQSGCTHEQEEALGAVFEALEKGGALPEPNVMPGVYCSVGKSVCDDMSDDRPCLCPGCSIHLKQALGSSYYCMRGSAEEVG